MPSYDSVRFTRLTVCLPAARPVASGYVLVPCWVRNAVGIPPSTTTTK